MPNTELITRPDQFSLVRSQLGNSTVRDMIKLKKLEIKAAREARITDTVTGLVTSPAVLYVGLLILLEYLSTHPENNYELFGVRLGGTRDAYISKDFAKMASTGLTAGLAANALGGGAGISQIIKALK